MRCDHCLLAMSERDAVRDPAAPGKAFCCPGCAGIYRLIAGEGLEAFYERRDWKDAGVAALPGRSSADPGAFSELVRDAGDERELELAIEGVRCASCVWLNERVLARTPGVSAARVSYATHRARVRFDPRVVGLGTILGRIEAIGYVPRPWSESEQARALDLEVDDLLVRLGTAGFLSSQLMIYSAALYAGYFQGMDPALQRVMEWIALVLTLPVFLYAGAPFLRAAATALRHGRFTMDSLVVLGSGSALSYSVVAMLRGGEVYFDTAAMIVTLVLAGRYVEASARRRAGDVLARLARLLPRQARLLGPGGDERLVPLASVRPGDRALVLAGERVPVDGRVVEGASEVDESLVTGEARPVPRASGDDVIGGSINHAGPLVVEVTRVGKDTVLAGIGRAVEDAQAHKPRVQALADRLTGIFVPVVLVLAAAAAAGHLALGASPARALLVGVSVVVIACPCALGLATPLAVVVATSSASARGILLKRGDVLERGARVSAAVLDKTGTVTRGRPSLSAVIPLDASVAAAEALAVAGAAELRSEHGLGKALREAARRGVLALPEASAHEVLAGRGVRARVGAREVLVGSRGLLDGSGARRPGGAETLAAERERRGESVVWLAWEGEARALFCFADVPRDEAAEALAGLRAAGLEPALLSGDGRATTEAVAATLGISTVHAETSPGGKAEVVAAMQRAGCRVLAVGDGLNDAPLLSRADVGVAIGGGADVTLESADVVLVRDDLRLAPAFVRLARRTTSIIRQNLFWALFYNVVAIPLAVAGLLHPIVAAAAMAASSTFVVLNSLRIRSGEGAPAPPPAASAPPTTLPRAAEPREPPSRAAV